MGSTGLVPASSGSSHEAPKLGDVLAGKYRVERVLGAGGMGVVVAASAPRARPAVAIKLMLPEVRARRDVGRALSARGARGGWARERARGAHLRRGHARDRRALHGDGAARGRGPRAEL